MRSSDKLVLDLKRRYYRHNSWSCIFLKLKSMTNELISYLKKEKYLNLTIESVTETFELYNYDVRFFGLVNDNFTTDNHGVKLPKNFELRIALYEDGAVGNTNANCTFFDPVAHHELVIYLEHGQVERQTFVTMVKETLVKFDVAKMIIELDNSSLENISPEENFVGISVELVNLKMVLDSGKRRNFM